MGETYSARALLEKEKYRPAILSQPQEERTPKAPIKKPQPWLGFRIEGQTLCATPV